MAGEVYNATRINFLVGGFNSISGYAVGLLLLGCEMQILGFMASFNLVSGLKQAN